MAKPENSIVSDSQVDDEISRAAFSLLVKEPFYAHVLAGMPRVVTDQVKTLGAAWNGQQVSLLVNPMFFLKELKANQRVAMIKHEVLHVAFRHIFRQAAFDQKIYDIAADLVVNQWVEPWPLPEGAITLESFPELKLEPDQTVEQYYQALTALQSKMLQSGFNEKHPEEQVANSEAIPDWAEESGKPDSAMALADCLSNTPSLEGEEQSRDSIEGDDPAGATLAIGDHQGWHDGKGTDATAGLYSVGNLLIRARERMPPHQWGSLPASLISELDLILAERQPKLDWRRTVRLFCASSGRTKVKHTIKRVSKRYGTRPGVKIQRMQRLLVAVDTSGSVDEEMLLEFFTEIHGAWRAGAMITVVECDAEVQRHYEYCGKPPKGIQGGGGTEFEPVFRWMLDQRPYDGMLYLTDGYGPEPTTRPNCKLLWVFPESNEEYFDEFGAPETLPFGPNIQLSRS